MKTLTLLTLALVLALSASPALGGSLDPTNFRSLTAQDESIEQVFEVPKADEKFGPGCRPICDYTWPSVTVTYLGSGSSCQAAQGSLDAQILAFATSACGSNSPCGVWTVITSNCAYNSTTRNHEMSGYGTFACVESPCI